VLFTFMPFILFVIVIVIPAYLIAYSIFSTHQGYWCDISEFAIKSLEMPLYVKFFVCFCMWSKEDKVDSELDSDTAETSNADLSFRVLDLQSLALEQLQRSLLTANVAVLVPCIRIFSIGANTCGVLVASILVSVASKGNDCDVLLSIIK
jgi:hypothetical protein